MIGKIFLLFFCVGVMACDNEDSHEPAPDPAIVYFLVTENDVHHNDSFILPLKDAANIAMARNLIETATKKIVMAEISNRKSDNYSVNKDLKNNRKWSWHISSFLGFVDNSIEIYDGWPGYVEENYAEWVQNTKSQNGKGVIGFWSYAVVREVNQSELY